MCKLDLCVLMWTLFHDVNSFAWLSSSTMFCIVWSHRAIASPSSPSPSPPSPSSSPSSRCHCFDGSEDWQWWHQSVLLLSTIGSCLVSKTCLLAFPSLARKRVWLVSLLSSWCLAVWKMYGGRILVQQRSLATLVIHSAFRCTTKRWGPRNWTTAAWPWSQFLEYLRLKWRVEKMPFSSLVFKHLAVARLPCHAAASLERHLPCGRFVWPGGHSSLPNRLVQANHSDFLIHWDSQRWMMRKALGSCVLLRSSMDESWQQSPLLSKSFEKDNVSIYSDV